MQSSLWLKKAVPHFVAVGVFLLLTLIVCKPALSPGMVLNQGDVTNWKGMAQQLFEHQKQYGKAPLWLTNMFSGMPSYSVTFESPWTPITLLNSILTLWLPRPMNFFFLASICFYLLCICLRIRPYVAIIGAIAFAYSTYNPIIIGAGHETKMITLAYTPALLAGIILVFDRKYLWGFALTALFTMLHLGVNHQQISYYFFIVACFVTAAYIIKWIREKDFTHMAKALGLVAAAGLMGILVNAVNLFVTYDYAKYSKRGGQLIMNDKKQDRTTSDHKTKGLTRDYAFQWSYGKAETFTLLFPGTMGYGAKGGELGENSDIARYLEENANQSSDQAAQIAHSMSGALYWGDKPFTEGPVYLGAIVCFLFVFAMFYLKSHHKWWILAASVLAIFMAWGKNFPALNDFLFDFLPLYNKFRAPEMILVIPQLLFPIAGALAIEQLLDEKDTFEYRWKALKNSTLAMSALFIIAGIMYVSMDYKNENTQRTAAFNQMVASKSPDASSAYAALNSQYEARGDNSLYESLVSQTNGNTEVARGIVNALRKDRAKAFGHDILRSLFFTIPVVLLLGLFIKKKITAQIALAGIGILLFADLYAIDKNYISEANFVDKDQLETEAFPLTDADKLILQDKDPNFRVLNLTGGDPFQESKTSYYFKSIGGYNAAKLGIYDDLITYQLSRSNPQVLNMLNTKYIMQKNPQDGKIVAIPNPGALGNSWFVKGVKYVENATEEMRSLDNLNPKDTAVVDQSFRKMLPDKFVFDSSATIRQTKFDNDSITYESNAPSPQVAIFSEIYYPGGWKTFIDGKPVEHFKANYVLRGLAVPAGKHIIEFRFEPRSYAIGYAISKYFGYLVLLTLAVAAFIEIKQMRKQTLAPPRPSPVKHAGK